MCGIIYGSRKDNVPIGKTIWKRYQKQKERGKQGFGFITIDKGKITGIQRFEIEDDMEKALKEVTSSTVLFHHRFPTSTPNYKDLTHPIVVKNDKLDRNYYVVHNGVLNNEHTLKSKHEKMGFEYTTILRETTILETLNGKHETFKEKFNDSEALAIEVALYLDGKQDSIDAVGTIAFVCVETDKEDNVLNIHFGRNDGNPLHVEDNNDLFFVKSLNGATVAENEIITMDFNTRQKKVRKVNVGSRFRKDGNLHLVRHSNSWPDTGTRRVIGFTDKDHDIDEEMDRDVQAIFGRQSDDGSVVSPYSNLLLGGPREEEDFASPEIADMVNNINDYEKWRLSDEYLLELWGEIEDLEKEIKARTECKHTGVYTDAYEQLDNEEMLDECTGIHADKQLEASRLERYLKKIGKLS